MNQTSRTLLFLAVALAVGCTPARRELPENNIARHINFEGNGGPFSGHNDLQLRQQLESGHTKFGLLIWPLMYFVEPKLLKPEILPREAYRLETWYAHNGWFDARVIGWQMRRVRDVGTKRAGVVDVLGFVDPGPPTLVRKLEVRGMDGPKRLMANAAIREGYLKEGTQYSLEYAETLRQKMVENLRDQTYAYAEVELQATAYPEEHVVDVTLSAEPGIRTRYGRIEITGQDKVKKKVIESAIPFEMGGTYKFKDLAMAQQRLFGMSTFSIVNVEPDLSDPTQELVPIKVSVTESKFRTLRIGVGGDIDSDEIQRVDTILDPGGISPRATIGFTHVNLLNQLIRFEADVTAGFDFVFTNTDPDAFQPTYGLRSSLAYPRIAGQRVAIELQGRMVQEVQSGLWPYRRQEADAQIVWDPYNDWQVRIGPHVEQYVYMIDSKLIDDHIGRLFGRSYNSLESVGPEDAFWSAYRLTALDLLGTADGRDDKFDVTRGYYYSGQLRVAVPIMHSGPTYGAITADGRWYYPLRLSKKHRDFPLILALGARGKILQTLSTGVIPYPERAFMGGANSIRGFRQDQVGPYDRVWSYDPTRNRNPDILDVAWPDIQPDNSGEGLDKFSDPEPDDVFDVPHGGTFAAQGSVEVRYRWINGITFATFADFGVLTEVRKEDLYQGNINLGAFVDSIRMSSGIGARYKSPIGPIRFDVSIRPLYPEDYGPDTHICPERYNCEEGREPRVSDFFSAFDRYRGTTSRPPFATVFFIAIGESI